MTANELVDKLKSVSIRLLGKETEQAGRAIILYRESAIMLRQQADRINVLEANHKIQLDINDKALKYIRELEEQNHWLTSNPLKELSDEEIEYEWFNIFKPETGIGKNITNGIYDFARAILKKASEK